MVNKRCALLIFVKFPLPGAVKTRMSPPLSRKTAAEVYRAMAEDVITALTRSEKYESIILFSPGNKRHAFLEWLGDGSALRPQKKGDLGEILHTAFADAFSAGYEKVVAVGTDCPDLSASEVCRAFDRLDNDDVVIGPARDGGYYLIGLSHVIPELFTNISWSTGEVYGQTLRALNFIRKTPAVLDVKDDIDTPGDLRRFGERRKNLKAPRTEKIIRILLQESDIKDAK